VRSRKLLQVRSEFLQRCEVLPDVGTKVVILVVPPKMFLFVFMHNVSRLLLIKEYDTNDT
jgi:hypothetical protein